MVLVTRLTWAVISSGLLGTTELVCNIPELFPHLSLSVLVKKKHKQQHQHKTLFMSKSLLHPPPPNSWNMKPSSLKWESWLSS